MCLRQLKYNLKKAMTSLFYSGGKPDDGAAVGRPQYLSTTTLHKHCKHQGPAEPEGPKGMCAQILEVLEAKPFLTEGPSCMPKGQIKSE